MPGGPMAGIKAGSTDPELLRRVGVLSDDSAWGDFFKRYDLVVRAWCSNYGFDSETVDELRQRIWVEMTRRMPVYQYDPGGSFRGWLRRLCHHRAVDLYRERRDSPFRPLNEEDLVARDGLAYPSVDDVADDGEGDPQRMLLLREAREAQEAVRRKVKPVRWEIFWRVIVDGEAIKDTAAALGLKYATVYAAARHVAALLKAEGQRRRAHLGPNKPPWPETE